MKTIAIATIFALLLCCSFMSKAQTTVLASVSSSTFSETSYSVTSTSTTSEQSEMTVVYPNPLYSGNTISFSQPTSYIILDFSGVTVAVQTEKTSNSYIGNLANGIYSIHTERGERIKFLINK